MSKKTVRITVGELFAAKGPLGKFIGKGLPIEDSYKAAKAVKKVEEELKTANEMLSEIFERFGKSIEPNTFMVREESLRRNDDGTAVVDVSDLEPVPEGKRIADPDLTEEFNEAYGELMEVEVEFRLVPVNLARLQSKGIDVAVEDMMAILWLFGDADEDEED